MAFVLGATGLLPPEVARDLRCVAVIGVAGGPKLAADGATYTAIIGAETMDATGLSREAVRDLIVAQVRIVRERRPDQTVISDCVSRMRARIAFETTAP